MSKKTIPPKVALDPYTLQRLAGTVDHAMQEWSEGKSPHEHTRQVIFEEAIKLFYTGRAWILSDVRRPAGPVPAKGALGLWEWEGGS